MSSVPTLKNFEQLINYKNELCVEVGKHGISNLLILISVFFISNYQTSWPGV
jgi:hypothetical protein